MASEGQLTSDSCLVRKIPSHLRDFVRSQILNVVGQAKDFSAEIHQQPGQPAKLVYYLHTATDTVVEEQQRREDDVCTVLNNTKINDCTTVVVTNVPSAVDEDYLKYFFSSKKKKGGDPVKHVLLNRQRNWAIVEFCEPDAVEVVMSKSPMSMMGTELDIQRYTPLVNGENMIESFDIRGLPRELTEDLLTTDIKGEFGSSEVSSAEIKSDDEELEKITTLKPVQLKLLTASNFSNSVVEKFPDVKVEVSLDTNEISFDGDVVEIQSAKLYLYETLNSFFVTIVEDIPYYYIELFKSMKIIDYINNKLAGEELLCAWEVKDLKLIVCSLEEYIYRCTNIIKGSVKEAKIPISRESAGSFFSVQWQNKLKTLQTENEVLVKVFSDGDLTEASIVTVDDCLFKVTNAVKDFLKTQVTIKTETLRGADQLGSRFAALLKINAKTALEILRSIANKLSVHYVAIDRIFLGYQEYTFTITGTAEGRVKAKWNIEQLTLD